MTIDFSSHKLCIFGIQGSGKTVWAKKNYSQFKKPLVFAVNDDDGWKDLNNLYVYQANRLKIQEEFERFINQAHGWAISGKVDLIIIDEADLFFSNNWDLNEKFLDLVLNHRHLGRGVALWFITRRPQDLPTKIVESSRFLVIYKLEGDNAIKKFNEINPKLPALIDKLDYKKHNYIFKEIGEDPTIKEAV